MAKRSLDKLHPYQQQALDYGADIRWVPNGMLQVTKARAREYVAEDPKKRVLLPLGLEHPKVLEDIRELAKNIEIEYNINISLHKKLKKKINHLFHLYLLMTLRRGL